MHMRSKRSPALPLFVWKRAGEDFTRLRRLAMVSEAVRRGRKNLPKNSKIATIILVVPSVRTIHVHWCLPSWSLVAFISNRCGVFKRTEIIQIPNTQILTRVVVRIVLYLVGRATASHLSIAMHATVYTDTMPRVNTRYWENTTLQKSCPNPPDGTEIESGPITYTGVIRIPIPLGWKESELLNLFLKVRFPTVKAVRLGTSHVSFVPLETWVYMWTFWKWNTNARS